MQIVAMIQQRTGCSVLFGRLSGALRGAGHAAVVLLATTLAGCEQNGAAGGDGASAGAGAQVHVEPDKTVHQAQVLLAKRGYTPGPADGLMGNRTVQAIREFQKAAGLPVTGKVNGQLIALLESGRHARPNLPVPRPDNDLFTADYGDIQPVYSPDDVFVWSNGAVDRVVRVGADNVVWRSSDGTSRTENRSFNAPPMAWQTESSEGASKIETDSLQIWPLEPGAEISFRVVNSTRKTGQDAFSESRETWRCKREGDKTIDVPAGEFETIVVTCTRTPFPKGGWRKRVWYYAPAVRHFVRRDSFDVTGRRLRIRLTVLRPGWKDWPPAARAGLNWAIQDTLTKGEKGIGVEWASSGVGTKLTIIPGVTFAARGNRRCRKYVLIQSPPMTPRAYPAVACWDSNKAEWLVPGLDDGAAPVSAIQ